jgi:EAL domain-containing protein (putative c-di-GMP-specific phosphodiesterase class I)
VDASPTSHSIGRTITVLTSVSLAVSLVALGSFAGMQSLSRYVEQKQQGLVATAQIFASVAAPGARKGDTGEVLRAIRAIGKIESVVHARVETGGRVLASIGVVPQLSSDARLDETLVTEGVLAIMRSRTIEASAIIRDGGEPVGRFVLLAETEGLFAPLTTALASLFIAALISLGIGVSVAGQFRRQLLDPVIALLTSVRSLAASKEARALSAAIDAGELIPFYQPIFDRTGTVMAGVEVLVRWKKPGQGFVLPGDFVPLAEKTGLIGKLDAVLLRQACRDALAWPELTVNVNASAIVFQSAGFARRVLATLQAEGFPADRLMVELTESAFAGDSETLRGEIQALRQAGIAIALDDFGTGFSNLSYLQQFRFDEIKIDRTFVDKFDRSTDSAAIVTAIISMSRAIGMTIVAEGVERAEQHDLLSEAGVHYMQGFYFAKPMPAADIEARRQANRGAEAA